MKKIKMLTGLAGHSGSYSPGEVVPVSDEIAAAWIKAGIAEAMPAEPAKKANTTAAKKPLSKRVK